MVPTDIRVAAHDTVIVSRTRPADMPHRVRVLREPLDFREPTSAVISNLNPGDTVFDTITYKKLKGYRYHRILTTWYRKEIRAPGSTISPTA